MTSLRKLPLAVCLPAALLLGVTALEPAFGGQTARIQDPAATRVAVVDIDRVLKSYPGAEIRQTDWQTMEAAFKSKMEGLRVEAQEAAADRESFDEGTEERARANLHYELKRIEYEETAKIFTAKADQFRMDVALDLYAEIRRGIAAFAKAKGIHVVMRARTDNPALPKSARLETNQQRDVLFHDPSIDLTEDVIRYLKTWKPDEGR